jgi:hypothetical protein
MFYVNERVKREEPALAGGVPGASRANEPLIELHVSHPAITLRSSPRAKAFGVAGGREIKL